MMRETRDETVPRMDRLPEEGGSHVGFFHRSI